MPQDENERKFCKKTIEEVIKRQGQVYLGWRMVPIDNSGIGEGARNSQSIFEQIFIGRSRDIVDELAFERRLYCIRKEVESIIVKSDIIQKDYFYITNISARTLSYKGLLMPDQIDNFFLDLKDRDLKSTLCLVHSRYSTNTFPTWNLAQPFRFLAHNGEINTLR